jgi:hypothetical protein
MELVLLSEMPNRKKLGSAIFKVGLNKVWWKWILLVNDERKFDSALLHPEFEDVCLVCCAFHHRSCDKTFVVITMITSVGEVPVAGSPLEMRLTVVQNQPPIHPLPLQPARKKRKAPSSRLRILRRQSYQKQTPVMQRFSLTLKLLRGRKSSPKTPLPLMPRKFEAGPTDNPSTFTMRITK